MPSIKLTTEIHASMEVVFDLSRSIDFHKTSTYQSKETAICGKTSGLIELGETVTWRAKHFGVYQKLTSKITEFNRPNYFVDELVEGIFNSFRHEHHFEQTESGTLMTDHFEYVSPCGLLGKLADVLFLKTYMTNFLSKRNKLIKEYAESGQYKEFLASKHSQVAQN